MVGTTIFKYCKIILECASVTRCSGENRVLWRQSYGQQLIENDWMVNVQVPVYQLNKNGW